LGTLLSSQTTDTPDTTHTHKRSRIAPEQLSKVTRIIAALQISISTNSAGTIRIPSNCGAQSTKPIRLNSKGLATRGSQL
ncbi:hypothetical protein, partial [Arthrobacter sp. AZCC_0090]|uniref:hypothetical protein n=1 Tax=Arthrobacter sp. AZCC_0090 TaxID=2735881 RepID=UPI001C877233